MKLIGYKSIDNFTYDDCVNCLRRMNAQGLSDRGIEGRYQMLHSDLERMDEELFSKCSSSESYQNYVDFFVQQGASLYTPKHIDEAKRNVIQKIPLKEFWLPFGILMLLLIGGGIVFILASFVLFEDIMHNMHNMYSEHNYIEYVDNILTILVPLGAMTTAWLTLKRHQIGLYYFPAYAVAITVPCIMFSDYLAFYIFSICCLLSAIILYGLLNIQHQGSSLWQQCEQPKNKKTLKRVNCIALAIWGILCILPYPVGKVMGFYDEPYGMGEYVIQAEFSGHPFYANKVAIEMAYGAYSGDKNDADIWFSKAIEQVRTGGASSWDSYIYVDYIYFSLSQGRKDKALELYEIACEQYSKEEIDRGFQREYGIPRGRYETYKDDIDEIIKGYAPDAVSAATGTSD